MLLNDTHKTLTQQGNLQSDRNIKFINADDIKKLKSVIKSYFLEAIAIEESGKKVEFKKNPEPIPDELLQVFEDDLAFKKAFYGLTPGRQRGYIIHFSQPKQSKTRMGRNEKYKQTAHSRDSLEKLIKDKYREYHNGEDGEDPRLKHCKTHVAIPIYDLMEGRPSVLKSKYHDAFVRDYHIPAYQAALATSAAPTYFDPFSTEYIDLNGLERPFQNKVDGGVFANNPTLNGIIEAKKAFNLNLSDLPVLSIGTGHQRFCDAGLDKKKKQSIP